MSQRHDHQLVEIRTAMFALHTKTNMIPNVLEDSQTLKLKWPYLLKERHIVILIAPL